MTSILDTVVSDITKVLGPLAKEAETDPAIRQLLTDVAQVEASLKAAAPAIIEHFVDQALNAALAAIPVVGPAIESMGAQQIDAIANALLGALYKRIGLAAPMLSFPAQTGIVATIAGSASDAPTQAKVVADLRSGEG